MSKKRLAIIGLGYVGLPLARLFATRYAVLGFDIDIQRVEEINAGHDRTKELTSAVLKKVLNKNVLDKANPGLWAISSEEHLAGCDYYIVTVPTPVDQNNQPDFQPLKRATATVGRNMSKGTTVIFESTVYPGATEEICVPILEALSGLSLNTDFFVGYSPERINPGDKKHTVEKIKKVTSGSTPESAKAIDGLYASVVEAGTYLAPSIKVAEAAKVIENSQRDINIAFVNELAKIFNALGIDTAEVLEAAGTKWNFLNFKPGLVGGHCIGVDPYYLAQKAIEIGYHPEIILAGRRLNDSMGNYVAGQVVKLMVQKNIPIKGAKVLVLGITFKENCPDVRNTRVVDVINSLKEFGTEVTVYDPHASAEAVHKEFQFDLEKTISNTKYQAVILAVAHQEFADLKVNQLVTSPGVIYDVKGFLNETVDGRL
ncbi:nucleotide sugar dehydrogenase [Croceiramulus getboli]|nr:nucleotide sugar dehydrogenase [Flavobacteriaceae bacterium YJPT1-3]